MYLMFFNMHFYWYKSKILVLVFYVYELSFMDFVRF